MKIKALFFLPLFFLVQGARSQDCIHCGFERTVPGLPKVHPLYSKLFEQIPKVDIEKVDYPRNKKATFCTRPIEMVDTLVLHHSETLETDTALDINRYHLEAGTASDPWYMIGYSYVINAPYPGNSRPTLKVTEGRPLNLVGSHAGTNVFVSMDSVQKKLWDEKKILCGREGEAKYDPSLVKNGKIKANVTTAGIVINGNYARKSANNIRGFSLSNPRYPTPSTLMMAAELVCQLQKQYPRMTKITYHSAYHPTTCPGTIKDYIGQIKVLAKGLGCEFI